MLSLPAACAPTSWRRIGSRLPRLVRSVLRTSTSWQKMSGSTQCGTRPVGATTSSMSARRQAFGLPQQARMAAGEAPARIAMVMHATFTTCGPCARAPRFSVCRTLEGGWSTSLASQLRRPQCGQDLTFATIRGCALACLSTLTLTHDRSGHCTLFSLDMISRLRGVCSLMGRTLSRGLCLNKMSTAKPPSSGLDCAGATRQQVGLITQESLNRSSPPSHFLFAFQWFRSSVGTRVPPKCISFWASKPSNSRFANRQRVPRPI